MLTILTFLTTFNIAVSSECNPIDCFITNHNQTLWVTSVLESCPLNKYPIDLLESFTCYSFNMNATNLTGRRIANNCNLHYDCIVHENKKKPDVSPLFFLAILMTFVILLTHVEH
jgi:hypothetical protein